MGDANTVSNNVCLGNVWACCHDLKTVERKSFHTWPVQGISCCSNCDFKRFCTSKMKGEQQRSTDLHTERIAEGG
jgi:hypothetical protein